MSLHIAGMGWVTPLGRAIDEVWTRLLRGDEGSTQPISSTRSSKIYSGFRVPAEALKNLPAHSRLRRASAISRFAVGAGLDALDHARSVIPKINMERTALIFAVSNGGIAYTKRFYHDVVESGAQSASPLFFPETVFNAPASHLAAILGINGATYTVVGDGAVGVLAIGMASDLLQSEALDYCLIVATEEADWLLCDAYTKWRLLRAERPIEPFRNPPRGTILSEGAGALLLTREGSVKLDAVNSGGSFSHQREAAQVVNGVLHNLRDPSAFIVGSANGTFVDLAEQAAITKQLPEALVYSPKPALGESIGASGIWQAIVAAKALHERRLPPLLHRPRTGNLRFAPASGQLGSSAIVLTCGLNQQAAGLRLSVSV